MGHNDYTFRSGVHASYPYLGLPKFRFKPYVSGVLASVDMKMDTKGTCFTKIGLHVQNVLAILGSTININGGCIRSFNVIDNFLFDYDNISI